MSSVEPQTEAQLTADWIRRVVSYTDEITYFGENSVGHAFAKATAEQTNHNGERQFRAVLRRQTILGSSDDALTEVAAEYGTPRLGATAAQVYVIVQPWSADVTDITDAGLIEVDDSSSFEVGDTIRLTTNDGGTSETLDILAITSGTGPNGGDQLSVGLIVNSYDVADDDPKVLLRHTLIAGTIFKSTTGVTFASLADVTTGDANPALAGESTELSLADKVLCECTTTGIAGNVEALTITSLQTADEDIKAMFNPGRATGGEDIEADFTLKFRASHQPQGGAVETAAFLEVLARQGNINVLRVFTEDADAISTLRVRVLTRSGGGLSTDAREALGLYMSQRLRSGLAMDVVNAIPTAIEVTADITLAPGPGTIPERLAVAWRSAAPKLATFLDWRKWVEETPVDEADLIAIVKSATGVATLVSSSFTPAADTEIPRASVPLLARLLLTETSTGATFGAVLEQTY